MMAAAPWLSGAAKLTFARKAAATAAPKVANGFKLFIFTHLSE
jgi:hypothetical protein